MVAPISLGRHRWTEAQIKRILELHKQGVTPSAIATRYNVTVNTINGVLHRNKPKEQ